MPSFRGSVLCVLALLRLTEAHTWIEQLSNIASDGRYLQSHGYIRNFVDRVPGFDQEANKWLLPPPGRQPVVAISQSDLLCHPSQRTPHQSVDYPRLQSVRGAMVAMRYNENGHATIPGGGRNIWGKPEQGGTTFVFGTSQPRADELLLDVLQWTSDGLGGDRRGRLLTAQNFDDGRCYQLGNGAVLAKQRRVDTPNMIPGQPGAFVDLLCETDVELPADSPINEPYTLYWVWQWPTASGKDPNQEDGKDEYYTSCADVDIVAEMPQHQTGRLLVQQDPIPTAVKNFASRGALTTNPLGLYADAAFPTPLPRQV